MNKRSLLFIALMTLTFMAVNTFFSSDQETAKQAELAKQVEASEKEAKRKAEFTHKKLDLSDFPIVSLYEAADESSAIAKGLKLGNNVLFLSSSQKLPSKLYYSEKSQPSQEIHYTYGSSVSQSPQIYSKTATTLKSADLATRGPVDVYLLWSTDEGLETTVGFWNGKQVELPLEKPTSSAIVLIKQKDRFLPCGIFQLPESHYVPLSLYPAISKHLSFETLHSNQQVAPELHSEQLYTLQTPYQQIVFSSTGGSIVGINLSFASENNKKSVVHPVEWDRQMLQDSPLNARFPLRDAKEQGKMVTPTEGGFYPLLRRPLYLSPSETTSFPVDLRSCTITSDYPELASLPFKCVLQTEKKIVFEAKQAHRHIRKTYRLPEQPDESPYTFQLDIEIEGDSNNLWINSGILEAEVASGVPQTTLKYLISRQNKDEAEEISLPKQGESARMASINPKWVANSSPFFGLVMLPREGVGGGYRVQGFPGAAVPTRLTQIDKSYDRFPAKDYPCYNLLLPLSPKTGKTSLTIYAGPLDTEILKKVDASLEKELGSSPNIVDSQTFHGWFPFLSKPISKLLLLIMKVFHAATSSWGLSIILLTVVLRLFLFPLSAWSFKSMKRMQQISPQVQAIQKRYKKEPKKAQMEVMALYRKEKVNPFMGCLPILIQMPFLIGMFDLLRSNFSLRGQAFIPGWINNLAAPDILYQWDFPIFFIGTEFHLLPLLIGGIMFIQQRLSSTAPKDPSLMTEQQRQQKAMGSIMTIFFSIMFYNLPAGVNLYWLSSMGLGILQQWYTNRSLDKKPKAS